MGGGSITPGGMNGHSGLGSNIDVMDLDGPSLDGMALGQALDEAAEQIYEDDEYKIWKQSPRRTGPSSPRTASSCSRATS